MLFRSAEGPDAPGDPRQLERHGLDTWLEQLKADGSALGREQEHWEQEQRQRRSQGQQLQGQLDSHRSQLAQLEGSLRVIDERLQALAAGDAHTTGPSALEEGQRQLRQLEAEIASCGEGTAETLQASLEALEQERSQLLSQRGQAEQRCQSLGALNPEAELEQAQAVWEETQAERQRLERQGQALQLLQERFHRAQAELANRYSEPLREAIRPYLEALASDPGVPLLGFDPQQGFQDLQLRQRGEAYGFTQLSGGMREQLAAALRLAMAEVLLPAYDHGLPLVFDDAFTQSDPQRLQGLKRMLQHGMQQGLQLVVLSCQPGTLKTGLLDPTSTNGGGKGEQSGDAAPVDQARDVVSIQLS